MLEDEIGLPDGGDAGVDQLGDVRMREPGQDCPSRLNRSSPSRPTSARFRNLTATWRSNRPSLRRASQTLPMPPWPSGETSV